MFHSSHHMSRAARQRGISIVELMVGLVVGLVVILGAIAVYLGAAQGGRDIIRSNRFNQDLRAVMDIMVSDIRRSGFYEGSAAGGTNLFSVRGTTDLEISGASRECILFAYDTTWRSTPSPGVVDVGTDFGGFRLVNGVVQTLRSTSIKSTAEACDSLAWEDLTDTNAIEVTSLAFDLGGSSCVVADPATYNASDPTTYVSWTTTSPATVRACDPTAPNAPAAAAYPPATSAFAEIRRITVSMTGRTRGAQPVARAPLVETILVRNNRVVVP